MAHFWLTLLLFLLILLSVSFILYYFQLALYPLFLTLSPLLITFIYVSLPSLPLLFFDRLCVPLWVNFDKLCSSSYWSYFRWLCLTFSYFFPTARSVSIALGCFRLFLLRSLQAHLLFPLPWVTFETFWSPSYQFRSLFLNLTLVTFVHLLTD